MNCSTGLSESASPWFILNDFSTPSVQRLTANELPKCSAPDAIGQEWRSLFSTKMIADFNKQMPMPNYLNTPEDPRVVPFDSSSSVYSLTLANTSLVMVSNSELISSE